jgi:hypothetical protein
MDEHTKAAPRARAIDEEVVRVSTLDLQLQTFPSAQRILLKLDTQGNELRVLLGADDVLARCHAVQVEVSFVSLYERQSSWLEVCSLLELHGLRVRHLEPGFADPRTGFLQQADLLFVREEA